MENEKPQNDATSSTDDPGAIEEYGSSDQNIVDWEGDDDPQNPRCVRSHYNHINEPTNAKFCTSNWTSAAKAYNLSLVIVLTFLTPLASSMFAPGVPQVLKTFRTTSTTVAEFVVSIYILGFAVGPLLISPLSEIFGRYPVYLVCNILFVIFTVACAVAQSMRQLIVFRFFAGCVGVCPVTLGGASIGDLIAQEKRGASMSLFGMGPLMGEFRQLPV